MRRASLASLMALGLSLPGFAQDGGKIPWRGKSDDPKAAFGDAKRQSAPLMLFFTSVG